MIKGKDLDSVPDLWIMDPDPGDPKTCPTLLCIEGAIRAWTALTLE
jgi:hypothetical protein